MAVNLAGKDFLIRPARDNDAHPIAQINEVAFKHPYELKTLREYRNNPLRFTMVAEYQGRVVAFMCVRKNADQFYLGLLAVCPAQQGKGIGRALIEWLIQALPRYNLKTIRLHTFQDAPGPQTLYRKMGFTDDGIERDFYIDSSSAVKMVYRLPPQSHTKSKQAA